MSKVKVFEMNQIMPMYLIDKFGLVHLPIIDCLYDEEYIESVDGGTSTLLPRRVNVTISRIIRDSELSRSLKTLYGNKCQICGEAPQLANGRCYSEVHHLKPLGLEHHGYDIHSNMIVVCPNHHVQLDYGAIAIIPDNLKIINYNGREIGTLKVSADHKIDPQFLNYHLENIYLKRKFL